MILMIIFLILLVLLFPAPAEARKKLPPRKAVTVSSSALPQSGLKLRGDGLAVLLTLTNLNQTEEVNYILTYQADEVGQGVEGSHDPASGNTVKELVFGTCSGNVCTYHQNITDMLFQVTIGLKDGQTLTRKYQINP